VIGRAALLLLTALLFFHHDARAQADPVADRAMAAATRILAMAKAGGCAGTPADVLVRVLCARRLTVGLRTYYPGFSVRDDRGGFNGFEPDIARRIAAFLGVELVLRAVDPKTRIPMLGDGSVDLVISTMGHSVQRDAEVRFIRPHYYQSQTAVVGPVASPIAEWEDLSGRTVCLPLGSSSNMMFVRNHVRILTFDRPEQLVDALRFNECLYIVQDDTFFAGFLADPAWSAQYGIKFRFSPQPWGMAVARDNADRFAGLLDALSLAFHADGTFLRLAAAHQLDRSFLEQERDKLRNPACLGADDAPAPACLMQPVDNSDATDASAMTPYVAWVERMLAEVFGFNADLSLLRNRSTVGLLLEGIGYSLALVLGTQASTLAFALGFGWLMIHGARPARLAIGTLTALGQVTPLPLLMFFVYVVAGGIAHYSGGIALAAAVFAIGLYNGSNAARALDEAHQTLLRQAVRPGTGTGPGPAGVGFGRTISLASIQLVAFLINAAKGSPAAGMIGVPEFLNVVTDLTANSRDRITMHVILLAFYMVLVLGVIRLLTAARVRFMRAERPG
jgi:ABC-type amino acid transport substrate-binding protein/ABC-type amino acid transport system permease subunit